MYYIKKYKYLIIIFIILVFSLFFIKNDDSDIIDPIEIKENEVPKVENKKIKIDIKGAVKNPGVYELDINSRVSDAIQISGGLNKNADTSTINLSKNLNDEMVIIVYTQEEINSLLNNSKEIKIIEKECYCPKLENNACINSNQINNDKISLNNANLDELMKLDGIGEKKAKDIIDYRNKNNGFKTVEELKEVSGIGESTFNKIKDKLVL